MRKCNFTEIKMTILRNDTKQQKISNVEMNSVKGKGDLEIVSGTTV